MAMFDIIRYEDDGNTLVYRYPNDEFNTKSQLIVQQSQEAVFYYRGALADHFKEPGHYTLDTANIPILCKLVNLPFGKESPFKANVYFIDKTERPNNRWGVGNIPFMDKEYGIPLSLGLCGEYSYKISDAILFIERVLGTIGQYTNADATVLVDKFVQSNITAYMTSYMQRESVDLFTMETELVSISEQLKTVLCENFREYGFELSKFVLTAIAKHEDTENYKRWYNLKTQSVQVAEIKMGGSLLEAKKTAEINVAKVEQQGKIELEAQKKAGEYQLADYDIALKEKQLVAETKFAQHEAEAEKIRAQVEIDVEAERAKAMGEAEAAAMLAKGKAEAETLAAKGLTGAQELGFGVALATAQNPGAGNMAATGIGLGTMAGVVGPTQTVVGGIFNDALNQVAPNSGLQHKTTVEENMGNQTIEAMPFLGVGNAGLGYDEPVSSDSSQNTGKSDRMARLKEAKEYFDMGLITEEEFITKKKEILEQI